MQFLLTSCKPATPSSEHTIFINQLQPRRKHRRRVPPVSFLQLRKTMDLLDSSSLGDVFDSSLNLEDAHLKEGYNEGYTDGLVSGKEEGREVGLKTGFEVGEELGFYRGCVDLWNSAIAVDPTCFSSRVVKSIKQMDDLVRKYPVDDPEDESASEIMDLLRLKFRAICATLNVKLEYNGYPKASDVEKNEF